jgi:hypothetical protein
MTALYKHGWQNKSRTSERTCACGTWREHWLKFSGKPWPSKCSVSGCENDPTLGAHVVQETFTNKHEYIVPMCQACNAKMESFTVRSGTKFVSANKYETCMANITDKL